MKKSSKGNTIKPTDALFESIYPRDAMLVIALVAQVGTNLNDLCAALTTRLENKQYEVEVISLSKLLENSGTTTREKQNMGTLLRKSLACQSALALCTAAQIRTRFPNKKARNKKAFIVRSLKRPEEVEALRIIYGEAFLAVGVHTPKSKRIYYLKDVKGDSKPDDTIESDENASDFYGQRIRDTFELCDFFIKGIDPEFVGLERALKLIFGAVFITPTQDEYSMAMAYAASLRSADLSRQVGAAIMNTSREIVATGANEVPRFGGGQPWEGDDPDLRDFAELKHDPNIFERDALINAFLDSIDPKMEQGELAFKDRPDVRKHLKTSGLLDITEFGRTVHAEMACLISCLRNHIDVRNSSLYSTTFPCHNCVRHILSSGITVVRYIEPYPKSRAQKLFSNSCSFWDDDYNSDTGKKISDRAGLRLEPFIGIGPRKYHDLFSMKTFSGKRIERKYSDGNAITETTRTLQDLKWPSSEFGALEREAKAVEQLVSIWDTSLASNFPEIAALLPSDIQGDDVWKQYRDIDPDKDESQGDRATVKNETKTRKKSVRKPSRTKDQGPIMNVEDGDKKEPGASAGS